MGWGYWNCNFTGIYTIIGGLKAVVYTETLQTVVLIVGSVIITYLGFQEVGGWNQLTETVLAVGQSTLICGAMG